MAIDRTRFRKTYSFYRSEPIVLNTNTQITIVSGTMSQTLQETLYYGNTTGPYNILISKLGDGDSGIFGETPVSGSLDSGVTVYLKAGVGEGSSQGGDIYLSAGTGGLDGGAGGGVYISAADASGASNNSAQGGPVNISAGKSNSYSGDGRSINLSVGGNEGGYYNGYWEGSVNIYHDITGSNSIWLSFEPPTSQIGQYGSGLSVHTEDDFYIRYYSYSTSEIAAGSIYIIAQEATGSNPQGGSIYLTAGTSWAGRGGNVTISAGQNINNPNTASGDVNIYDNNLSTVQVQVSGSGRVIIRSINDQDVVIQPSLLFTGSYDGVVTINDASGSSVIKVGKVGSSLGFFNVDPVLRPTVTGSRGGNVALQSLLVELSNIGLIIDNTSA